MAEGGGTEHEFAHNPTSPRAGNAAQKIAAPKAPGPAADRRGSRTSRTSRSTFTPDSGTDGAKRLTIASRASQNVVPARNP